MYLLTENIGRGLGMHRGMWALRTLTWEWFTQGHYSLSLCDLYISLFSPVQWV